VLVKGVFGARVGMSDGRVDVVTVEFDGAAAVPVRCFLN